MGTGLNNPQIRARDPRGGVLGINRVRYRDGPDKWWLTGPSYGLGTERVGDVTLLGGFAEVGEQGLELAPCPGRVNGLDPLVEFIEVQPTLGAVLAQDPRGAFAVGVTSSCLGSGHNTRLSCNLASNTGWKMEIRCR